MTGYPWVGEESAEVRLRARLKDGAEWPAAEARTGGCEDARLQQRRADELWGLWGLGVAGPTEKLGAPQGSGLRLVATSSPSACPLILKSLPR